MNEKTTCAALCAEPDKIAPVSGQRCRACGANACHRAGAEVWIIEHGAAYCRECKPGLQLPTVHLNGTSKERLIEGYCAASQAIDLAYEALKQAAPNGRDYYPQGPAAMAAAEREHLDRLSRLDAVKAEIDALTMAIDRL